jgi:KRAB domain-containing zinc finger protein
MKSHENIDRVFECNICGWHLLTRKIFTLHMRTHSDDHPYSCNICNKTFKFSYQIKYYMRIHTVEKNYFCDVCGVAAIQKSDTENHRKRPFSEFKGKCGICDRGFYTNSDLQEPKNIHTGARLFKCNMYSLSFPYCNNLTTHKKTHMPQWKQLRNMSV